MLRSCIWLATKRGWSALQFDIRDARHESWFLVAKILEKHQWEFVVLCRFDIPAICHESWWVLSSPRFSKCPALCKSKNSKYIIERTSPLCACIKNCRVLFFIGPYWLSLFCPPPLCKLPMLTFIAWILKPFGFYVIDLLLEIGFRMIVVHALNMITTKHGTTTFAHYLPVAKRLLKTLRCSRLNILTPWWTDAN